MQHTRSRFEGYATAGLVPLSQLLFIFPGGMAFEQTFVMLEFCTKGTEFEGTLYQCGSDGSLTPRGTYMRDRRNIMRWRFTLPLGSVVYVDGATLHAACRAYLRQLGYPTSDIEHCEIT